MARGGHSNSRANLRHGNTGGANIRRAARRLAGIAWARAWRVANAPLFDAMYGMDPNARVLLPDAPFVAHFWAEGVRDEG